MVTNANVACGGRAAVESQSCRSCNRSIMVSQGSDNYIRHERKLRNRTGWSASVSVSSITLKVVKRFLQNFIELTFENDLASGKKTRTFMISTFVRNSGYGLCTIWLCAVTDIGHWTLGLVLLFAIHCVNPASGC